MTLSTRPDPMNQCKRWIRSGAQGLSFMLLPDPILKVLVKKYLLAGDQEVHVTVTSYTASNQYFLSNLGMCFMFHIFSRARPDTKTPLPDT